MKKYLSVTPEQYPHVYAYQVTLDNLDEVKGWVRGIGFRIYAPVSLERSLFGVWTYNCVTQVKEGDFVVWVDDWYFKVLPEGEFFKRYWDADKSQQDEESLLREALIELIKLSQTVVKTSEEPECPCEGSHLNCAAMDYRKAVRELEQKIQDTKKKLLDTKPY